MTHWVKFQRAHEHLDEVERIVGRFLDMQPYRLICEYDPKPPYQVDQKVIFSVRFHAPAPIPESLARVVGDCLTNLRASLDHLVYAMALKYTGEQLLEQTFLQFAIKNTPDDFKSWRGKIVKAKLLPDSALDYIEGKQPYMGHDPNKTTLERHRQRQPLWVLNTLVNADKHRALTAVTQIRVSPISVNVEGGTIAGMPKGGFACSGAFQHGDPIFSVEFVVANPATAKVDIDPGLPAADVAFDREWPGTGKGVRGTLQILRDYIRDEIFVEMEDRFL